MWIVCQIGAREHYAIARALSRDGVLEALITDFWVEAGSCIGEIPGGRRLKDRYHPDLAAAKVIAPNLRMLGFEAIGRLSKQGGWDSIIARNDLFQRQALAALSKQGTKHQEQRTLFSYSYAARDLFRFAKERGWKTVLGQIDPGPEEERIVSAEHERYPSLGSHWQPAPSAYWQSWREELDLADRIIVNSPWSRECLLKEGVSAEKIEIIPLVYDTSHQVDNTKAEEPEARGGELTSMEPTRIPTERQERGTMNQERNLQLLFLGQINLRKGIGRLLDAMRLLKDEPVELILAGSCGIDPRAWADLPKVTWIGSVPRSEVGEVYRAADVFILPTLSDGYALTQLEALNYGLPVIASKCCGEAVQHGENGWLLKDLEPETIAESIRVARVDGLPDEILAPRFGMDDLAARLCGAQSLER